MTQPLIRNRHILVADILAVALAAWAAFAMRFGWLFMDHRVEFPLFLAAAVATKILTFFGFGLYERYWRYASFWDLMAVVMANSVAAVVLTVLLATFRLLEFIPQLSRSVIPIDWLLGLALTTGVRASIRILAETASAHRPRLRERRRRHILVAGAGDAGAMVVREMIKNPQLGMVPVGFLDDDSSKTNKRIYGVPVLGSLDQLGSVAAGRHIDEVVIALPRVGGTVVREVAESCQRNGLRSRVMPGLYELLDGQFAISRLRELDIADLLQRPQIVRSPESPEYLSGATVLITGAGGSIGAELSRQVALAGPRQLVLLGHGENSIFGVLMELRHRFPHVSVLPVIADIRDARRIGRILRDIRPDIVFHAAAHKHVPLMEENVTEAITNNVLGTRNVVEASRAAGAPRLVLVSTDKAAAPTSVMGASKRIAEMIVRNVAHRDGVAYSVVRFGNVLGSRGSVVQVFKSQIERGGPVTVTHPEVRRYFMTIPEAVHLVLQAGGLARGGELFVLDMGKPVLIRELAADMIRLSGFDADQIPVVFTGLQQGEKLDEVLWEDGAKVTVTEQPDIRRVVETEGLPPDRLATLVDRLIADAVRDETRALATLTEGIPTANLAPRPPAPAPLDTLRVIRREHLT